jgi:hypothetical protein
MARSNSANTPTGGLVDHPAGLSLVARRRGPANDNQNNSGIMISCGRRELHLRVAEHDGHIFLDLADGHWRAVEIRPDGWSVICRPPVRALQVARGAHIPPAEAEERYYAMLAFPVSMMSQWWSDDRPAQRHGYA